jgi:hypothetical protein
MQLQCVHHVLLTQGPGIEQNRTRKRRILEKISFPAILRRAQKHKSCALTMVIHLRYTSFANAAVMRSRWLVVVRAMHARWIEARLRRSNDRQAAVRNAAGVRRHRLPVRIQRQSRDDLEHRHVHPSVIVFPHELPRCEDARVQDVIRPEQEKPGHDDAEDPASVFVVAPDAQTRVVGGRQALRCRGEGECRAAGRG